MPNTFFAMLARMKLIRRWGLMFSVREENLAEHTLDTAFFTHALIALHNARFLPAGEAPLDPGPGVQLALYHDAPEILTGDLPTPVKYQNPQLRDAYKEVEAQAARRLLEKLPEELAGDFAPCFDIPAEYVPLVKAADKLSALAKCQEEKNAGSHEFDRAYETTLASLREMDLPEAGAFLEEFFPAYRLTLDEL